MIFTIRWNRTMACYRINEPNFDAEGTGVEVVRVIDLLSDANAEDVSRRLNPGAWEVVDGMPPSTRTKYADSLKAEARGALASAASRSEPTGEHRDA